MKVVTLRPIVLDDWERVHQWTSTDAACRYQAWGPNSQAETRAFVEEATAAWTDPSRRRRVFAAEASNDGVVGLGELQVHSVAHLQAEISYSVHVDLWGRGLGEAIARGLIEIAAGEGMHRVRGTCDPRNVASGRVLQKVGMTHEGRMRHTLRIRDGWRDSDVYGLVLDDR